MNLAKLTLICSLLISLMILLACQNEKNNPQKIITDDMVLEIRANNRHQKGKLKIIGKNSKTFQSLKSYINGNLKNFKEVSSLNVYPNTLIVGENLKIILKYDRIYLKYKNSDNKIKRFSKKISTNELPSSINLSLQDNWIYDFGDLYGYGQFKTGKYMACDLTYHEVVYKYKVGYWKFWNLNRELMAKGKFKIDSTIVTDRGGCDFTIKMSKINKDNWTFYKGNGQKGEPTIEQLYRIKNAEN